VFQQSSQSVMSGIWGGSSEFQWIGIRRDSGHIRGTSAISGCSYVCIRGVFTSAGRLVGGRYFVDCNEPGIADRNAIAVASYAVDPEQPGRLWEVRSISWPTGDGLE
jgi:hypothetical protein